MIVRTGDGLTQALQEVKELSSRIQKYGKTCETVELGAKTHRMLSRCMTAEGILQAALLRTESRGSHYRADFPERDESQTKSIIIGLDNGAVCAAFC